MALYVRSMKLVQSRNSTITSHLTLNYISKTIISYIVEIYFSQKTVKMILFQSKRNRHFTIYTQQSHSLYNTHSIKYSRIQIIFIAINYLTNEKKNLQLQINKNFTLDSLNHYVFNYHNCSVLLNIVTLKVTSIAIIAQTKMFVTQMRILLEIH